MICGRQIVAAAVCLSALAPPLALLSSSQVSPGGQGPVLAANPAPSPEQMRALLARIIENQHRDDRAVEEYERTEHAVNRRGENGEVVTDITVRRVPSGAGDVKLKLSENGIAVSPDVYRHELEIGLMILGGAEHPDDRYNEARAKYEKRRHDRAELVEAAGKAFRIKWAGRETRPNSTGSRAQRNLSKYLLDPDPEYKPVNRFAASFQHIHATVWVDETAAQIARVEADIATDISFGGGIAGKVYHGGHVVMEQEEVEPGIWLPTLYIYDVDGRKFLFAFSIHERTEISQYRRIGSHGEALKAMREELNNLTAGALRDNATTAK